MTHAETVKKRAERVAAKIRSEGTKVAVYFNQRLGAEERAWAYIPERVDRYNDMLERGAHNLVGVYDHRATHEMIREDVEFVMRGVVA